MRSLFIKTVLHSNRIGIFGGTFDPPHNGHLAIAEKAKKQLKLTKVFFVPANIAPHKQNKMASSATSRLRMLQLLIEKKKYFNISTTELHRKGISYTIDTVKTFYKRYPNAELTLIIGTDNLAQFHIWKSPKLILRFTKIAVYDRKGYSQYKENNRIGAIRLKGRHIGISSTEIRDRVAKGLSIKSYVPLTIASYIKKHSLYKQTTRVT